MTGIDTVIAIAFVVFSWRIAFVGFSWLDGQRLDRRKKVRKDIDENQAWLMYREREQLARMTPKARKAYENRPIIEHEYAARQQQQMASEYNRIQNMQPGGIFRPGSFVSDEQMQRAQMHSLQFHQTPIKITKYCPKCGSRQP